MESTSAAPSSAAPPPVPSPVPLCVDLDGTLVLTDTIQEAALLAVKRRPGILFQAPFWLLHGREVFKNRLTERAVPDAALLPYREELLDWLKEQAALRPLYLVTGSDQRVADAVAANVAPLFSAAWGSNATRNLSGSGKARFLVERFGAKGFDYAGNASVDLKVWKEARQAVVAGAPASLVAEVRKRFEGAVVFPSARPSLASLARSIRVQQWAKNILVFTVLFAAHQLFDIGLWLKALTAFMALSLMASAIYVINDLLDLEADRKHPQKRKRPFASGRVPAAWGVAMIAPLLAGAAVLAAQLPPAAQLIVGIYPVISVAYSFYLKRQRLVDVFTLSLLSTIRVLLGAAATGILCSQWLMGFCSFFFLSLAFSKRASELINLQQRHGTSATGRAYFVWDLAAIQAAGIASGFTAGIVLTLYMQSREVHQLYARPEWLWVIAIGTVYWLVRVWLIASRGALDEDPVLFAIRDRSSYLLCGLFGCAVILAKFGWFGVPGIQ